MIANVDNCIRSLTQWFSNLVRIKCASSCWQTHLWALWLSVIWLSRVLYWVAIDTQWNYTTGSFSLFFIKSTRLIHIILQKLEGSWSASRSLRPHWLWNWISWRLVEMVINFVLRASFNATSTRIGVSSGIGSTSCSGGAFLGKSIFTACCHANKQIL